MKYVLLAFGLFFYFLPTIIGVHKRNALAIFLLNLLTGWTGIGWVAALVWSVLKESSPPAETTID